MSIDTPASVPARQTPRRTPTGRSLPEQKRLHPKRVVYYGDRGERQVVPAGLERLVDAYAVDPAWDMTPAEYTATLSEYNARADGVAYVMASCLLSPTSYFFVEGAATGDAPNAALTVAASVAGVMLGGGALAAMRALVRGQVRGRRAKQLLATKSPDVRPPVPLVSLSSDELAELDTLAASIDDDTSAQRRAEVLEEIYTCAHQAHVAHAYRDAARTALTSAGADPASITEDDLQAVITSGIDKRSSLGAAGSPLSQRTIWAEALARFETVRTQWEDLIVDPLNALEHAQLFDVGQPRTAAFIDTYGAASDVVARTGGVMPTSTEDVASFDDLARKVAQRWDTALRASAAAGYAYLPPAEARRARRAAALLRVAADETLSPGERSTAATRAGELLAGIHTVLLPAQALAQLQAVTRLALPAGG